LDGEGRQSADKKVQGDRGIGYIQNAEQNESTVWKRMKERQQ
jgi:hypothetical protein